MWNGQGGGQIGRTGLLKTRAFDYLAMHTVQ